MIMASTRMSDDPQRLDQEVVAAFGQPDRAGLLEHPSADEPVATRSSGLGDGVGAAGGEGRERGRAESSHGCFVPHRRSGVTTGPERKAIDITRPDRHAKPNLHRPAPNSTCNHVTYQGLLAHGRRCSRGPAMDFEPVYEERCETRHERVSAMPDIRPTWAQVRWFSTRRTSRCVSCRCDEPTILVLSAKADLRRRRRGHPAQRAPRAAGPVGGPPHPLRPGAVPRPRRSLPPGDLRPRRLAVRLLPRAGRDDRPRVPAQPGRPARLGERGRRLRPVQPHQRRQDASRARLASARSRRRPRTGSPGACSATARRTRAGRTGSTCPPRKPPDRPRRRLTVQASTASPAGPGFSMPTDRPRIARWCGGQVLTLRADTSEAKTITLSAYPVAPPTHRPPQVISRSPGRLKSP